MSPAESLNANGTVNQGSIGSGGRGTNIFNTYTTYGDPDGETWRPDFNYFGMQWVQVQGLPEGYVPDENTITGLQTMADVPVVGGVATSNDRINRINRINRMVRYSVMSNTMSVFTDCPGREKLSYPADYTMPMGMIHRNFDLAAYLRTQSTTSVARRPGAARRSTSSRPPWSTGSLRRTPTARSPAPGATT